MSTRLSTVRRLRALSSARGIAPIAVLLALALPVSFLAQSATVVLSVELPKGPSEGARLFSQKGCVRCHSIGEGGTQIAPNLGGVVFVGNVLELAGALWNHAPVMRAKMQELGLKPPTVTPDEMADLVAFLTAYRHYDTRIRTPGNAINGRAVFVGKRCAGCHEGPTSWTMPGPNLQKYSGRYAPVFLAQGMWNHSSKMTAQMRSRGVPRPTFTGQEMTDLTAYLQLGSTVGAPEPMYVEPGNPSRGQMVFADKRCSACHAIAGKGASGGPDLGTRRDEMVRSVMDIAAAMWNHRLQMDTEFQRRGIPFVTFAGQEMADVIAYLYFVNYASVRGTPVVGQRIFVQHCSACHASGGKSAGPDLATAPGLDKPIAIIAAMWNHAGRMEEQMRERGLTWPRMEPGDTADLTAFLIAGRRPTPARR